MIDNTIAQDNIGFASSGNRLDVILEDGPIEGIDSNNRDDSAWWKTFYVCSD